MNGQILINKNNLTHNLSEIQKYAKDSKIMSVIKSNGYGHGILEVASALKKSDAFAVATINEAIYLRNNNIEKQIAKTTQSKRFFVCSMPENLQAKH